MSSIHAKQRKKRQHNMSVSFCSFVCFFFPDDGCSQVSTIKVGAWGAHTQFVFCVCDSQRSFGPACRKTMTPLGCHVGVKGASEICHLCSANFEACNWVCMRAAVKWNISTWTFVQSRIRSYCNFCFVHCFVFFFFPLLQFLFFWLYNNLLFKDVSISITASRTR